MARHWSAFVAGLTPRQASALDSMARAAGEPDGMTLLVRVSGCSSSKIGRMDRLTLKPYIDECFARWGREAQQNG